MACRVVPPAHNGPLPDKQPVEFHTFIIAVAIFHCDVTMAVFPLDRHIQPHRIVIHGGICNKSTRQLLRFVMNVKLARAIGARAIVNPQLYCRSLGHAEPALYVSRSPQIKLLLDTGRDMLAGGGQVTGLFAIQRGQQRQELVGVISGRDGISVEESDGGERWLFADALAFTRCDATRSATRNTAPSCLLVAMPSRVLRPLHAGLRAENGLLQQPGRRYPMSGTMLP
ncbi:hypothetical protein IF2G_11059 [Cordyceps javanica]|nr:hypothetical protein IF2G_11059 [Cordyceps javanica]